MAVLKSKAKNNITVFDFVDAVRSSKYRLESGVSGNKKGVTPDVIQKLSTLESCGVQVIDYNKKLEDLVKEMSAEATAPVFTFEELL